MVNEASLRSKLSDWIEQRIEDESTAGFKVPDLVDETITHFSSDNSFMLRCAEAYLRSILSTIINGHIIQLRTLARVGTQVVTKSTFEKRLKRADKWRKFMEYVPGRGHVLLVEMTKRDITGAIGHRNKTVRTELATIATLRTLAAGLSDDKQTVGNRYTTAQIAAIYRKNAVDTEGYLGMDGDDLPEEAVGQ
jgi:hypothetical protein